MPILTSISKRRWAWQLGIVGAMVSPNQQRSLLVPSGITVLRCIYHIYGVTASLPWIASTWVVSRPQVMCGLLPRHSHTLARHCPNLCVLYIPSLATVVFLFSGQSAWAHWTKRWVQGQWDWAFVALELDMPLGIAGVAGTLLKQTQPTYLGDSWATSLPRRSWRSSRCQVRMHTRSFCKSCRTCPGGTTKI